MSITHEEAARVRKYVWSHDKVPTVRIAVLGSAGVGKRSILQRLCYGCVIEGARDTPVIELEWHKHVIFQGKEVHVQFDLVEGEPLDMSEPALLEYVRPDEACFLIYDVTRRETFDVLDKLRDIYLNRRRIPRRQARRNTFFVIGNRIDRWRGDWAISAHEADELSRSFGATFHQMSALTGSGTGDEAIVDMLGHILLGRVLDEAGPRFITAPVLIVEEEDRESIHSLKNVEFDRISSIQRLLMRLKNSRPRTSQTQSVSDGRSLSLSSFATKNIKRRRRLRKTFCEPSLGASDCGRPQSDVLEVKEFLNQVPPA